MKQEKVGRQVVENGKSAKAAHQRRWDWPAKLVKSTDNQVMATLQSETETTDNEFRVKSLKDVKGILNNIQLQESYMKMVNSETNWKNLKHLNRKIAVENLWTKWAFRTGTQRSKSQD